MTLSLKHFGLLAGIIFVFVSCLFFGRQQGIYQILMFGGLIIASIFYLIILFGKGSFKTKIFWTAVVVISVITQELMEPFLIDTSYRIYINQNKKALTEINNILIQHQGDLMIMNDDSLSKDKQLTTFEKDKLKEGMKKINVYLIVKSNNKIYYELWGFLDVRLGITYSIDKNKHDNSYRHLTGNWFH